MNKKNINPEENNIKKSEGKLELIATQRFDLNPELYKIIDFLNRNLKKYNFMFGLSKDSDAVIITIYEVE